MSTDYNYDENGQFFPYFILTLLGLVLVPLTYSTFAPNKELGEAKRPLITETDYAPPQYERVEASRRRQAKRERRTTRFLIIAAGWTLFSYMCYLIATTQSIVGKIWDPYEILDISMTATEKQIKSHYKKLAIKYHPDKIRPSENETAEMLNERFVEISKAYKALTDEDVRNNYIQFGHPDGKQSFSIGIALPKWIVSEGNTYYVLAVYGVLFGILLPYTVGKWWYGTRRHTKDGVMVESAGNLFTEYAQDVTQNKLISILTCGEEVREAVGELNGDEAGIEKKVAAHLPLDALKDMGNTDGWRRKALALMWAYLLRIDLGDEKLDKAKLDVAPAAIALNRSWLGISIAYGNLPPVLAALAVSQHVIQAVPPGKSPLLQLPYFNDDVVSTIESESPKHWTVQQLMALPEDRRKKLCSALSEKEYKTAIYFASHLPAISVEAAFFKVMGEKFITPSSLVQFVLKMRIVPPGTTAPPVNEADLADVDSDETDVEALIGRRARWSEGNGKNQPSHLTLAHSPYYPRDHPPTWYIILADPRQGKLVVPPHPITSFDKSTDGFAVVTAKMQFQAPPQPGEYNFQMKLVSDSYLGCDSQRPVTLIVSDPSKVERIVEVDDISDPEEDSVAGQLSAMRGGKVKKIKREADSSDEEESDTEGEVNEESATDTETDEE